MTKQEVIDWLKEMGIKVSDKADEITDEIVEKVEKWKSQFDTETRRTVRKYWIIISTVTFLLGLGLGLLF